MSSSSSLARHNLQTTQIALFSLAAVFSFSFLLYLIKGWKTQSKEASDDTSPPVTNSDRNQSATNKQEVRKSSASGESDTTKSKDEEKALHAEIEELDKRGKALFKDKQVCLQMRRLVTGHYFSRLV
jgi:hypothetical protein